MEFLVILFFFGLSAATVAKIKGSSFFVWFLIGFSLPMLGTLAALFYRYERHEPKRQCTNCGRTLALHVQVCMSCGEDLDPPPEFMAAAPARSESA